MREKIKNLMKNNGRNTKEFDIRYYKRCNCVIVYYKLPVKQNIEHKDPMRPGWTFFDEMPDEITDLTIKLIKKKVELYKKEWRCNSDRHAPK